jgi:hypothetical protein
VSNGSWGGFASSFAYQWSYATTANGSYTAISGATSSSYTVDPAYGNDYIEATVTGSNAGGPGIGAAASAVGPIVIAPVNTAPPVITGTVAVGSQLSASTGTWSNSPTTYSYQWSYAAASNGTYLPISGATSSTYTVDPTYSGDFIEVTVLAGNTAGSVSASSAATSTAAVQHGGAVYRRDGCGGRGADGDHGDLERLADVVCVSVELRVDEQRVLQRDSGCDGLVVHG